MVFNYRNEQRYVIAPPKKVLDDPRREILKPWDVCFKSGGRLDGESDEDMWNSSWWDIINMAKEGG